MKRLILLKQLFALSATLLIVSACTRTHEEATMADNKTNSGDASQKLAKLEKSRDEWRQLLTSQEYDVLFEEDTEYPFSSPLNKEKREGTFICAACYLPLFSSSAKFESGTGWPSFFQPLSGHVGTKSDYKLIAPRTEYHCIRCGGHQGHVFDDGPLPTGQRWCNNGVALKFVPEGEPLPHLRY
jgi:peptide-methionine (R)-S-oxide reductase